MNPNECRSRLVTLLQMQLDKIVIANDFLDSVKAAIAENRVASLQQTLTDPDLAIDEIEHLEQQRFRLLSHYGFSNDSDGFSRCVKWCDDDQYQVSDLYQRLIRDLLRLQQSIQLNNLLVTKGKDRVRRSIGILTGNHDAGGYPTYGSSGKTLDPGSSRDIAIV